MKIVTSQQMRQMEERSEQAGVSTGLLMENAGLAVASRVRAHLGAVEGRGVLVLVGPGNNGGDGLVAARHLHRWGARCKVYLCGERRPDDLNLSKLLEEGAEVVRATDKDGLNRLTEALDGSRLVVDAVLGTGRARPMKGLIKGVMLSLRAAKDRRAALSVLALDLPSGLDADTGAVDPLCPVADITVTLAYPKVGLYRFPGAAHAGRVEVADIGIPSGLDADIPLELISRDWAKAKLPPRPPSAHKGTFGRTLVVAGSKNYVGAAYLAASGAGRSGAGLVTVAIPESLQLAVAASAPEPTYLPLPESSRGVAAPEAASIILESLSGYDSLLVGCGMGQAPSTQRLLEQVLYSDAALPPTVVDADGLNFLAGAEGRAWWERMPSSAVVTPHPGEMARLMRAEGEDVREDRVGQAREAAARWNKIVALKGAFTVVAFPSGMAMLSPFANPALSTAGTGDVLAGAIAGLLAQGMGLGDGAALGVYLHGAAGNMVSEELGDAGVLAGDLLPAIPQAIKKLRKGDKS